MCLINNTKAFDRVYEKLLEILSVLSTFIIRGRNGFRKHYVGSRFRKNENLVKEIKKKGRATVYNKTQYIGVNKRDNPEYRECQNQA